MKIFSASFVADPFLISKRKKIFSDRQSFVVKDETYGPFRVLDAGRVPITRRIPSETDRLFW